MSDLPSAAQQLHPAAVRLASPPVAGERCPRCGGSGQLRTDRGTYRSCLHCAARGIVTVSG